MNYETIETVIAPGVALIWLNRPDLRNAMNDTMIAELTDAIEAAIDDESIRAIVLAGRGKAFCAGGDLNWMKRANEMTPEEAFEDSRKLAKLLRTIHDSPKPVIARVHGAAFAGGMGLVAACDIAVASHEARFCLSEVKLGLIPAMISPYVIGTIGANQARRWFLTAEVIEAGEAWRIGLVHELAPLDELDAAVNAILGHLVQAGPLALGQAKRLIRDVAGREIDDELGDETARRIAEVRASAEAQEGIAAFFAKRPAAWVPSQEGQ
ncbi:MAG: enoyl-CoA hydratase/isomerase family protein [Limnobacter sp.]|nr:enoyl-CoA hydratase/isomerase family protein [Limnobacter sp.]